MANKILTDRVSVRVTAKQSDQSSQNKATGRTLEKALGGSGLTDAQAEAIGANIPDNKMAIDENGNLWLDEDQLVAAGKAMYANGVFDVQEVHEGINGYDLAEAHVYKGPGSVTIYRKNPESTSASNQIQVDWTINAEYFILMANAINYVIYCEAFGKTGGSISRTITLKDGTVTEESKELIAQTTTLSGVSYSYFSGGYNSNLSPSIIDTELSDEVTVKKYYDIEDEITGYLFGPTHTTGESRIDWTAPDDDIKQQIDELHETWEISEHENSFVLAGPIEYDTDGSDPQIQS